MKTQSVLRHEKKFEIHYRDYLLLRSLLRHTFSPDPNADEKGDYFVRSVYFDTTLGKDYYDKVIGTHSRKKLRLRTYDLDARSYKLEMKYKLGSLLMKDTVVLSDGACHQLLKGHYDLEPLLQEEGVRIRHCLMQDIYRPVITIDYEREAYVHAFSNIRINFDKNIRSNNAKFSLSDKEMTMQPINYDQVYVLEVKYNDFLPDWLRAMLSQVDLTQTSFSKYCYSRLF